jgi:hypothetical protein
MWSRSERSKGHYLKSQGRQLVAECESFLVGELPAVFEDEGLPVPEWAWLSMLAHAPSDGLVRPMDGGTTGRFRGQLNVVWLRAVDLLAQELIMVADRTGCTVEELQHDVLLDVELNWERPRPGTPAMGPSRFVEEVRNALHRFRGSSRSQ